MVWAVGNFIFFIKLYYHSSPFKVVAELQILIYITEEDKAEKMKLIQMKQIFRSSKIAYLS